MAHYEEYQMHIHTILTERSYSSIPKDVVDSARDIGLCVHHEVCEFRDAWFAAHPDWVENYHRNGGTWAYVD